MGTNFYWISNEGKCPHCGRSDNEELHIGKSSAGWCFSLKIHPEEGIKTLEDWEARFPLGEIRNEYGDAITPEEMSERIRQRGSDKPLDFRKQIGPYRSNQDFYSQNHAMPGPNNLLRHQIDGRHCVGHGEGTWDYMEGSFS